MQQINTLPANAPVANPVNPMPSNTIELNGIHLPEQVSNAPMAYGFWLLATLIIVMIIAHIIKLRKKAKLNKVKKEALAQFKSNPSMNNNDIIILLKWAAMHYFSRTELAKLFGHSLQEFLMLQLPVKKQKQFSDLSEQAFLNQYHIGVATQSDENLQQAAVLWLNHALPPKPLKKIKNIATINPHIVGASQSTNKGADT